MTVVTGTICKIWHNGRGHDYAVACIDKTNKKIGLIKNNSINNDGSMHGALRKVSKWLTYNDLGATKIAPKITRIKGYRELDVREVFNLVSSDVTADVSLCTVVVHSDQVISSVQNDIDSVTY